MEATNSQGVYVTMGQKRVLLLVALACLHSVLSSVEPKCVGMQAQSGKCSSSQRTSPAPGCSSRSSEAEERLLEAHARHGVMKQMEEFSIEPWSSILHTVGLKAGAWPAQDPADSPRRGSPEREASCAKVIGSMNTHLYDIPFAGGRYRVGSTSSTRAPPHLTYLRN